MRIFGIDPGLAAVGWGFIIYPEGGPADVEWGQIRTQAGEPTPKRLLFIYNQLIDLIGKYEPDAVAIEELFFCTNVKTAMAVAQARGAALLALADFDLSVAEYTPLQIKKAVSGRGGASKEQVQKMVAHLLGLKDIPKPDHAADALAAAICHGHTMKIAQWSTLIGKRPATAKQ